MSFKMAPEVLYNGYTLIAIVWSKLALTIDVVLTYGRNCYYYVLVAAYKVLIHFGTSQQIFPFFFVGFGLSAFWGRPYLGKLSIIYKNEYSIKFFSYPSKPPAEI